MRKENYKQLGNLSEWDEDSMWMSYRYCIGRHSIASHQRAGDIAKHCYKMMSWEESISTAYDINSEVERCMFFNKSIVFKFPILSENRICVTALDAFFEFIEENKINCKQDLLWFTKVEVIRDLTKEKGYSICVSIREDVQTDSDDYFSITDINDLIVWNDLAHLFDVEHHHRSILIDDSICEWFWTWTERRTGNIDTFKYEKIRVPVDSWSPGKTVWIPSENIKENIE